MNVPDALPVLSKGHHPWGSGRACLMDAISWLSGQPEWGDAPECVHPVLRAAAIEVNDRMPESERYKLWALVPDLIGTAPEDPRSREAHILSVSLACFAARYILPRVHGPDWPVCEHAIATAEAWCEGRATLGCLAAANAAYGAHAAAVAHAATPAVQAARACAAAAAHTAAARAAHAAVAYAAVKAAIEAAANPYGFFVALVAEHKRLTDHQPRPVEEHEWDELCEALGVR